MQSELIETVLSYQCLLRSGILAQVYYVVYKGGLSISATSDIYTIVYNCFAVCITYTSESQPTS
jgi:hypothetical protein